MNQLNKNRLIGGGVLAFTALLFAPSILTPEKHDLTNPTLVVNISDNVSAQPSSAGIASVDNATTRPTVSGVATQPSVKLESLSTETGVASNADAANQPSARLSNETNLTNDIRSIPVVLGNTTSSASSAKPSATVASTAPTKSSWLRVGSFSSQSNADNLLKKLKTKYSVKVETITNEGTIYHRVLVGPYETEEALQKAKNALNASGYQPGVQR